MDTQNIDKMYMARCLELAQNGQGNVAPNPMVGALIVHDNQIIGVAGAVPGPRKGIILLKGAK